MTQPTHITVQLQNTPNIKKSWQYVPQARKVLYSIKAQLILIILLLNVTL